MWRENLHVMNAILAYDLGLFSPSKLRMDLRNILADQNSGDEDPESAVTNTNTFMLAAMQLMNPCMNPMAAQVQWKMMQQTRDIFRRIDQLSRGGNTSLMPSPLGPSTSITRGRGRGGRGRSFAASNRSQPSLLVNADQSGPGGPLLPGACGDLASNVSQSDIPNCGFTDKEVEELLHQGLKPWDAAAVEALAALHGEYDYLLQKE